MLIVNVKNKRCTKMSSNSYLASRR